MADNEEMKEIVAGMIDRDMLIRWTLEAKDREIETLKIANGIFSGRAEELEQLLQRAYTLLDDISQPFKNVERHDVKTWLADAKSALSVEKR